MANLIKRPRWQHEFTDLWSCRLVATEIFHSMAQTDVGDGALLRVGLPGIEIIASLGNSGLADRRFLC